MLLSFGSFRAIIDRRAEKPPPDTNAASGSPPALPALAAEAPSANQARSLPAPLAYRAIVSQAAQLWLGTRLAYAIYTYFAVLINAHGANHLTRFGPAALLSSWQQWDTNWYLNLAHFGYWSPVDSTAFFPLYPLLIHLLSGIIGESHALVAALIISNLATLAAFIGLGLLAANEIGATNAARTILIFAAYPLAFFMTAAYSEGLFLACTIWCLFCLRRGRWLWAAAFACLAALTRSAGIMLVLPLLWEYARQHNWPHAVRSLSGKLACSPGLRAGQSAWSVGLRAGEFLAVALAAPIGIGLYAAYLWLRFGQPLAFVTAEQSFHRGHIGFWQSIPLAISDFLKTPHWTYEQALLLVDLAPLLIFLLLTLISIRRLPFAFTLYLLGLFYLYLSEPFLDRGAVFAADGRYMLTAVPIFLLLGRWASRWHWLETLLVSGGFLLQAVFLSYFLSGGPII